MRRRRSGPCPRCFWAIWPKSIAGRARSYGSATCAVISREALAAVPADGAQSAILGLITASDPAEDKAATLAALEKDLGNGFFRCHSSFLINLEQVTRLDGADVVLGSERLPVSKYRRKMLLAALAACGGETL